MAHARLSRALEADVKPIAGIEPKSSRTDARAPGISCYLVVRRLHFVRVLGHHGTLIRSEMVVASNTALFCRSAYRLRRYISFEAECRPFVLAGLLHY